jgi:hypothetical protein
MHTDHRVCEPVQSRRRIVNSVVYRCSTMPINARSYVLHGSESLDERVFASVTCVLRLSGLPSRNARTHALTVPEHGYAHSRSLERNTVFEQLPEELRREGPPVGEPLPHAPRRGERLLERLSSASSHYTAHIRVVPAASIASLLHRVTLRLRRSVWTRVSTHRTVRQARTPRSYLHDSRSLLEGRYFYETAFLDHEDCERRIKSAFRRSGALLTSA